MEYLPFVPMECPKCGDLCGVSIELLEHLEFSGIDQDQEDLEDIDKMVEEALRGEHTHESQMSAPNIPFPMAIDTESKSLIFLAWCFKCKKVRTFGFELGAITTLLGGSYDKPRSN